MQLIVETINFNSGTIHLLVDGLIEPDDDAVQVRHLSKFVEDLGEGRGLQFGIERRQDQADFSCFRKGGQFIGQIFERPRPQIVQRRDIAVLVKVSHAFVHPRQVRVR